jgi:hypothetical protein
MNGKSASPNRFCFWISCILLFFFFSVRLWLAAQGKEFWMDETDTIFFNTKRNIWLLITEGADGGQASRTPLYYIIERAWMYLWSDLPQQYWDLRFFFRIFPVAAWSAGNVYLFAHLWRYFSEEKQFSLRVSALFAFAIAQFSYSNNFGSYYAIESRPYAMWAAISILHLLAVWQIIRTPKKGWLLFYISSALLVLTTYAAMVQIFLAAGLLALEHCKKEKRLVFFDIHQKKIIFSALGCLIIGLCYFTRRETMDFAPAPFSLFWTSVMEVLLKAFHHHSFHAAFVTVPLLLVVIPLYWRTRSHDLAVSSLHAILIIFSVYPLYLVATHKGALFASRYVIYIMPALTFLYVLGVVTLLILFLRWLEKITQKKLFLPVLVGFALLEAVTRPIGMYKGIGKDLARFSERRTFALHDHPDCSVAIPHNPWDLELMNNNCRGFTAELPKNPYLPKK